MIGKRVRTQRKSRGYSITKLARLAGVSKSYLSYIERDLQQNPSLQILSKIAITLDTTIEDLLDESFPADNNQKTDAIDKEWEVLIQIAIDEGMNKKDFKEFQNFLKFKDWEQDKK